MNLRRGPLLLLAGTAGLSAGFACRWWQRGGEIDGRLTPPATATRGIAALNPGASTSTARKLSPLAAKLESQLTVSTGVMRWLEWMDALEHATLADFPSLARMAKGNPVAVKMIAAQWIATDPSHLFETLVVAAGDMESSRALPLFDLAQQLAEDWTKRDPAAAIAALSRDAFPGPLRDMRYSAVNLLMKEDPETALKTMAAWHIENYSTDTEGIGKWAAADPRHAAEFALAHPAGYMTQSALEVIGKAWAKTDPAAALSYAADLRDGYGVMLAGGIVREWASADLSKAAAWLAEAPAGVRNRISGPMVEIWAKTDTSAALDWVQDHLNGSSLDEAVGAVLKGAARKDVAAAADLVTGMEPSLARAKAAVSVARQWFPEFGTDKPVPPEAVAWISSLDEQSMKHVLDQVQWQWSGSDSQGFARFLASPAGKNAPEYALSSAARALARQDPVEALAWANSLPEERRGEAAGTVFTEWQSAQPAAATEWLNKLPAGDPRREAFYTSTLRQYMPTGEDVSHIARAMLSDRPAALEAVQKLAIPDEYKQTLKKKLGL